MMKKVFRWFFPVNDTSINWFIQLLLSWRFLLVAAIMGGLIGWLGYQLSPPRYEARATVVVDNNLETIWTYGPDRRVFYYLERETRKLEELAYSDTVLEETNAAAGGKYSLEELREDKLFLSQPMESGWHFWAYDRDKKTARGLASAWAAAFVSEVENNLEASPELAATMAEFNTLLVDIQEQQEAGQTVSEEDWQRVDSYLEEIAQITEHTKGVSPVIEIYLSQSGDDIPIQRAASQGLVLLIGSVIGILLGMFGVLFFYRDNEDKQG
ncbi:MAG: hypothetical protein JXA19_02075 [Anaerolineales bacterium]|nr:hypothetical protein [Anaerolineales bacterium]